MTSRARVPHRDRGEERGDGGETEIPERADEEQRPGAREERDAEEDGDEGQRKSCSIAELQRRADHLREKDRRGVRRAR